MRDQDMRKGKALANPFSTIDQDKYQDSNEISFPFNTHHHMVPNGSRDMNSMQAWPMEVVATKLMFYQYNNNSLGLMKPHAIQNEDNGGYQSKLRGQVTYQYQRGKGSTSRKQRRNVLDSYEKMRSTLSSKSKGKSS